MSTKGPQIHFSTAQLLECLLKSNSEGALLLEILGELSILPGVKDEQAENAKDMPCASQSLSCAIESLPCPLESLFPLKMSVDHIMLLLLRCQILVAVGTQSLRGKEQSYK